MNLDDLKDRFQSEGRQLLEKIQDSSIYNQMMDRYENLSPVMQKITLAGLGVAITAGVLSIPYDSYNLSKDYEQEFVGKRDVIRDLLKTAREAQSVPNITLAPTVDLLRSMVQNQLTNAQLIPEQIVSVSTTQSNSKIIPAKLASGAIEVKLAKMNLKQVVDIGYQLQGLNSSVKMKDLTIQPNAQDSRYMDVTYRMVALAVPDMNETSDRAEESN